MMSTVGLELTNFINPDLTWKTVSKGNRSATRRTRKSLVRNLTAGVELADKSPRRAESTTVLESEKLGVAVLGRRFSDKMEHVPIKKRKYNLRSPSPPSRTPSPHVDVAQHASIQGYCRNSYGNRVLWEVDASTAAIGSPCVEGNIYEEMPEKLDDREDFSGIEILAAAACDNSFDVDQAKENKVVEESLHKEDDSKLVEETVAPMETTDISLKCMVLEDKMEESSFQDASTTSAPKSPNDKDNKMVEKSVPPRDDRLHWDLNVVIDAWDQPCDFENAGSQTNAAEVNSFVGSGKVQTFEGCKMVKETKDVKHDEVVAVDSTEVCGETDIIAYSRDLLYGSNRMDNQLDACSGLDCDHHDECGATAKASTEGGSTDACLNSVPCPDNTANKGLLHVHVDDKTECCASGVQEEEIVCIENVEIEKCDVASPFVSALDRVTSEVDSSILDENAIDSERASSCAAKEIFTMDGCEATIPLSLGMEPSIKAEEVGDNHILPGCVKEPTSSAAVEEVRSLVTGAAVGLADEALGDINAVEIKSSVDVGPEGLMHMSSGNFTDCMETGSPFTSHEKCGGNTPTNSSVKIEIEGADDISESDASQGDKVHVVATKNSGELQAGYDSQFEDGELRESDVHCWEDNEGEGAEIEQVDYESECDGERLCIFEVEDTENKTIIDSGTIPGPGVAAADEVEQCSVGDHLTSSKMRTLEAIDGSKIKNHIVDGEEGPDSKDFTSSMVGPRALERDLPSHIQGSLSTEASDAVQRNGSNDLNDLCPRSVRGAGSSKFMGKDRYAPDMRCRSPGGGRIVSTRQSPTYHDPCDSGRSRPRNVFEGRGFVMTSDRTISEAAPVGGLDNCVRRQYLSSSSNYAYRPLNHRYLAYKDDIYGSHAGTTLVREDVNPDRSRFRKYPQGVGRGMREDHRRRMPTYEYTDHMPHRLSRRERSPGGGHIVSTRQSPTYHDPYGSGHSRPRNVFEGHGFVMTSERTISEAAPVGGLDNCVRRQCLGSSSNYVYQSLNHRYMAYKDDVYGSHAGTTLVREDVNPDRSRFRKYPQGVGRGMREDYRRHMPTYEYTDHMPHRLSRKERSISPLSGERLHYAQPYKKSRSRSRSRSPGAWLLLRERNEGSRRRSRSPNFRSGRMDRVRMSFQKRFPAEYEEGFISPPRNRFSPQHNSRFDDRISGLDNFRDRKSPARMFRQSQRFESVCSVRPLVHPRRLADMGGGGSREYKYEGGDDDRRKQGSRYEMMPRVRHYDTDGVMRRLRYNNNNNSEESFVTNDS